MDDRFEAESDPFRRALQRAGALAESDPKGAARMAGGVTVALEARVHAASLSVSLKHPPSKAWDALLFRAANTTGQLYEQLSYEPTGESLTNSLIAAEYFELAAAVGSKPHIKQRAQRLRASFDSELAGLSPEEQVPARIALIKPRTNLARLNAANRAVLQKLDGTYAFSRTLGRETNCQRVVPATVATLISGINLGAPQISGGEADRSSERYRLKGAYEWAYQRKFAVTPAREIVKALEDAGPGSVGIVMVKRHDASGHVTTVANIDGLVLNVEGQSGDIDVIRDGDLPHERGATYEFLMVRDASRDLLPIDEFARARELLSVINSAEFANGDNNTAMAFLDKRSAPEAVRAAVRKHCMALQLPASANEPARSSQHRELYDAARTASSLSQQHLEALGAKVQHVGLPQSMGNFNNAPITARRMSDLRTDLQPGEGVVIISKSTGPHLIKNVDGIVLSQSLKERGGTAIGTPPALDEVITVVDLRGADLGALAKVAPAREPIAQGAAAEMQVRL